MCNKLYSVTIITQQYQNNVIKFHNILKIEKKSLWLIPKYLIILVG